MKNISRSIAIGLVLSLMWGCGGSGSSSSQIGGIIVVPPTGGESVGNGKARLIDGFSCENYKSYLSTAIADSYFETSGVVEVIISDPAAVPTPSVVGDLSVSGTNNQEVSVDEGDIIKADSNGTFYVARYDRLTVVKGYPAEQLDVLSELVFDDSFSIKELILDEQTNRLAIVSYPGYNSPTPAVFNSLVAPINGLESTRIKFLDISDPASPVEVKELEFSGSVNQTRLVDGQLLVILRENIFNYSQAYHYRTNNPVFSDLLYGYFDAVSDENTDLAEEFERQGREYIRNSVDQTDVNEFLPSISQQVDGSVTPIDAISCNDIYKSEVSVRLGMASMYRLSLNGDYKDGLAAIVSPYTSAYVSNDNIYIYQRSSNWWFGVNQVDESAIHQITYGVDSLAYKGTGVVPGYIHNRFSLSEYDGYLRVATSETVVDQDLGTQSRTNHMHVLLPDDQGVLNIVGATPTYGDDEVIRSARFLNDKAYVVTFRQIDPLFAFDLSVPTSPRILGELKIPGFSEYIHPVGTDRLITVGRNGDDDGLLPGVNFQLFDVSDLANPTLLHSYVPADNNGEVSYSWSTASYDSRAFTYVDQNKLLVVPFTVSQYSSIGSNFSGFLTFEVNDADGFRELGRIDHEDLLPQDSCETATTSVPDNCFIYGPYNWVTPLRSVVIGDSAQTLIYSLSNAGIQVNEVDSAELPINGLSF